MMTVLKKALHLVSCFFKTRMLEENVRLYSIVKGKICLMMLAGFLFPCCFSAHAVTKSTFEGLQKVQAIDSFGVNVTSQNWHSGEVQRVIDMLADQKGSKLWRVVIDQQQLEATNDNSDPNVFNLGYYNDVFSTQQFRNLWRTIGYLNQKGFSSGIILSLRGRIPEWMVGSKINASAEDEWVAKVAALVFYARNTMQLSFSMLEPINAPDSNGYERLRIEKYDYARLLNKLSLKFAAVGLRDIKIMGLLNTSIETSVNNPSPVNITVVNDETQQPAVATPSSPQNAASAVNNAVNATVAISLVQKASNISSSALSLATTFPAALTAGNLVVVSVSGWPNLPAATPVTDSLGNTYSIAGNVLTSSGAYSAIYYARNIKGGSDTVTFRTVASGGQVSMAIAEFAGIDPVSPLDVVAGTTGSGTTPSSGVMTPTMPGDLVIGSGTHNGNTVTSAGAGFTLIAVPTEDSNTHQPLAMEYQVLSGTQATAAAFSLAAGFGWTQNGVLFKPAVTQGPDITPPLVPSGLAATPLSTTQINLSWAATTDPVISGQFTSGVAGYQVFRVGNGTPIATTTATTYADAGLQATTNYSYAVNAFDVAGNVSAQASPVSATTLSPETIPPSVPGNLSAIVISATQINLSWSASTDNVGVAGYQVFRDGLLVATTTTTAYSDTGLAAGTTHQYAVAAVDTSGNLSAQSLPVSATTTSFAFDDEFDGSSLDTNAWIALDRPGDQSNSELQYYTPANVALVNGLLNITSQVDNSHSGYSYTSEMVQWRSFNFTYGTIEFSAKLAGGQGTWPAIWMLGSNCQQTNVISADNTPPCNWPATGSDEINITEMLNSNHTQLFQGIHSNGNNLGCTVNTGFDVTQNLHKYVLIWAPGSLTWQIDGATTCRVTTGVPSTPMFLMVNTALGGAGGAVNNSTLPQTLAVDYLRVTPYDTFAPSVPANLVATAVSSTQINLSWSASTDNVAVTGYRVYRGGVQIATVTGTTYSNTGLSASTTYSYTVSAYDASGNNSAQSLPSSATTLTPDTTLPTVSITSPLPGTVSGTITVVASASDNVAVTKVEFYLDNVLQVTDTASPYNWSWNTTQASNALHNLTAKAYDAAGNIGTSTTVTVTVSNTVASIVLVQKNSNTTSSAQSLARALPSSVTAGNLIVVSVSGWPNNTIAVSDNRGNSYSIAGNVLTSSGAYSAIYYAKNVVAGTTTVTVRTGRSGAQISMVVAEFSGVDTVSPLDSAAGAVGTGTAPSSGSMTPTNAGDLVIGSGTHNGNTVTTAGSGFTMIAIPTEDSNTHQPLAMEYRVLTGTPATAATFSLGTSYGWTQNGALFKHK